MTEYANLGLTESEEKPTRGEPLTLIEGMKYPDAVRLAEKLIAERFHVEVIPDDTKTLWPRFTVKAWDGLKGDG